jgi:hypothetical protein
MQMESAFTGNDVFSEITEKINQTARTAKEKWAG